MDLNEAVTKAREIIAGEVDRQNRMWGDGNDRADIQNGQLQSAATAQLAAVEMFAESIRDGETMTPELRAHIFEDAKDALFPKDWGGFRDYGSDIANLGVVGAYIENEIKRRLT